MRLVLQHFKGPHASIPCKIRLGTASQIIVLSRCTSLCSSDHDPSSALSQKMVEFLGLLKVKVIRGKSLAVRDLFRSDPYVKLSFGHQEVKTRVMRHNLNPEWNEELTLSIPDPLQPLNLQVFDKDMFSTDDKMGDAKIDLQPLIMAARLQEGLKVFEGNMNLRKVVATNQNGFVGDSTIQLKEGKIVQGVCVRLQNVEKGQLELELKWQSLPTSERQVSDTRKVYIN